MAACGIQLLSVWRRLAFVLWAQCLGGLAFAVPAHTDPAPSSCAVGTPVLLANQAAPDLRCLKNGVLDAVCLRTLYRDVREGWPAPVIDAGETWREWGPIPGPASCPQKEAQEDATRIDRVNLGARLFFDGRLSRKSEISCASCHQPQKAFTDGRPLAVGEDGLMGKRRTPTLFAAPFSPRLFWDGRATSLRELVAGPISNPAEMNHDIDAAAARLEASSDYPAQFQRVFGKPQEGASVTADRLARALAAYLASLRPVPTAFDALVAGGTSALSDQALIGMHLFRTKARCINCHNGALLTDNRFHNIGLSYYGRRLQDLGRFEYTRDPADLGAFRTPSLRNVSLAGPWMHNGVFPNLKGLLRMYSAGMPADTETQGPLVPRKSDRIRKLDLTPEDIEALEAFLRTL